MSYKDVIKQNILFNNIFQSKILDKNIWCYFIKDDENWFLDENLKENIVKFFERKNIDVYVRYGDIGIWIEDKLVEYILVIDKNEVENVK